MGKAGGNAELNDVVINFTTRTKGIKAALQNVSKGIKRIGQTSKAVAKDIDSLNDFITGLSGKIQAYYYGAQIVGGALRNTVGKLANEFINVADQQDRFVNKLNALTGGEGLKTFERLNAWALEMPVNTAEAINAFTTMKAYGLDPTLKQMESLVDVSAVFGEEAIPSVARAMGQMASLGKVSAEEINQLAEAGINARKILSDAFGMTVEEIQKSGIAIEEVIDALWKGLDKEFGGAAKGAMNQWGALINAGVSYWKEFIRLIADTGAWQKLKEQFRGFIGLFRELFESGVAAEYARKIGGELARVFDMVKIVISGISGKTGIEGALDLVLLGAKALTFVVAHVGRSFLKWKIIWAGLKKTWGAVTAFITEKLSGLFGLLSKAAEGLGLEGTAEKFDAISNSVGKWAEEQGKLNIGRRADYEHAKEQLTKLGEKYYENVDARSKLTIAQEKEKRLSEELTQALQRQEAAQAKLNQTQSAEQYQKNAAEAKSAAAEVARVEEQLKQVRATITSEAKNEFGEDVVKKVTTVKGALKVEEDAYKNLVAVQAEKKSSDEQLLAAQSKFHEAQKQTVELREKQFQQQIKQAEATKKEKQEKEKAAAATAKQAETAKKAAGKQSEFGNASKQAADSVGNLSQVMGNQSGVAQKLSKTIDDLARKYQSLASAAKDAATKTLSGSDQATTSVQAKARGGILSMAEGGALPGSSPTPTSDNLLFAGTAGEYVHPVSSVQHYGQRFMEAVRRKLLPKPAGYAFGGVLRARREQPVSFSGLQGDLRQSWGGWGAMQDFGRIDINMGGQEIPVWTTNDYSEMLKQAIGDGQDRGNKWFTKFPSVGNR